MTDLVKAINNSLVSRPEVVGGVSDVEEFLTGSRSQRMREVNGGSGKHENLDDNDKNILFTAKIRMKQLNAITSRTHLPHSKFNNQQTHFDDVRLVNPDIDTVNRH